VPFYLPDESLSAQALEYAGAERFWQEIETRRRTRDEHRVVLLVHGYSLGFEKGCGRAAALQRALGHTHTVVLFSWPSNAQPADYTSDGTDMTWSVPDLAALLAELRRRLSADRMQVVAHSMGARGTVEAIHWLGCLTDDGAGQVDQLVLLAPDMDPAIFHRYRPWLAAFAAHVTVYVSANDTPLTVSGQLHGHPRLGEAGPHLAAMRDVEIVDVSAMGRYHVTGHEYYHYHPVVRSDLVRLLTTGQPAPLRPGLIRRTDYASHYWAMVPATDL
jgi:esterase/lipase superfamily enzyme